MKQEKISEIIELNKLFYKTHAEEFSRSRQNPWPGWDTVLEIVRENLGMSEIEILDLGCGNGRFYKFLTDFYRNEIKYTGFDNNDYMLVEALLKYELGEFLTHEVIKNISEIDKKADLVVAFGLTHHIPGYEFRQNWFKQTSELVKPNGLLIFSFWQLDQDERASKLQRADDLEENDYYYGWADSQDKRYVHIYAEDELNNITNTIKNAGFDLINTFENDGKSGKLNKYLVFKRISS